MTSFPKYRCDICRNTIVDLQHRYRCLKCSDFDICVTCFSKKSHSASHPLQEICPSQLIVVDDGSINDLFRCNSCKKSIPKKSMRFHCQECFDVDMCEDCYKTKNHVSGHESSHKLELFTYSNGYPISNSTQPTAAAPAPSKTEPVAGDTPLALLPNTLGGYTLVTNSIGVECSFNFDAESKKRTVFVDKSITDGIYHMLIRIKYGKGQKNTALDYGVAPTSQLRTYNDKTLGEVAGSCCFSFGFMDGNALTLVDGVKNKEKSFSTENTVADGALVGAELDVGRKTLCFFNDGKKHPVAISGVKNASLNFGIDGAGYAAFTTISLRRLTSATPSDVKPTLYEYISK